MAWLELINGKPPEGCIVKKSVSEVVQSRKFGILYERWQTRDEEIEYRALSYNAAFELMQNIKLQHGYIDENEENISISRMNDAGAYSVTHNTHSESRVIREEE